MQFGLFLKKKGVISAEQLVAALEAQLARLPRIGQLALEEGIISPRDIFHVLHAQRGAPSVRFGELAIEMSLMTRDELMHLLMLQADRKKPLAEVLITEGVLSEEVVAHYLAKFHQLQANQRVPSSDLAKVIPSPRGVAPVVLSPEMSVAN